MEIAALEKYKVVLLLEDMFAVRHKLKYLVERPISLFHHECVYC